MIDRQPIHHMWPTPVSSWRIFTSSREMRPPPIACLTKSERIAGKTTTQRYCPLSKHLKRNLRCAEEILKRRGISPSTLISMSESRCGFSIPRNSPPSNACWLEARTMSLREAHNRLIQWEERMRRINRKSVRIEILALLALVCHKQRDEAAALQNLQTALDLAESGSWIRTFVDLGLPMMDLLNCLIQHQTGQTYAQHVLKACQAEHSKKASLELDATTKPRISEISPDTVLTRREIDILPLLAEGLSNKEIAARLHIAPVTVKTHLQNIYKKLNTKNRIEALKKSREIGIIIDN